MPTTDQLDAISTLIEEHRIVKEQFQVLLDTDREHGKYILQDIKGMLAIHNASEENVIYPAVSGIAERPQHARTLYHEQDDAEVALWELANLDWDDEEFLVKALSLRDALLAHIRREEETEFKYLRESLTSEAAARLTAEFQAFREALCARSG
jgi:hemerythrin-like domain-containing protein